MDNRILNRLFNKIAFDNPDFQKSIIRKLCTRELDFNKWKSDFKDDFAKFDQYIRENYPSDIALQNTLPHYKERLSRSLYNYSRSNRFAYTVSYEEDKRKFWEQQYHKLRYEIISAVLKSITDVVNSKKISKSASKSQPTDSYLYIGCSKNDIERYFDNLRENYMISKESSKDDFIYYFTGDGQKPNKKIQWVNQLKFLAIFISELYGSRDCEWKIVEQIFESKYNLKYLKNILYNQRNKKSSKDYDFVREQILNKKT